MQWAAPFKSLPGAVQNPNLRINKRAVPPCDCAKPGTITHG